MACEEGDNGYWGYEVTEVIEVIDLILDFTVPPPDMKAWKRQGLVSKHDWVRTGKALVRA